MRTRIRRRAFASLSASLVETLLLVACGTATPAPATTADPPATAAKASDAPVSQSVALAFSPKDKSLYLADERGLSKWRDGAWTRIATPSESGLSSVVVNPGASSIVYASGPGLGVVRSNDGGNSWSAINTGLPALAVTALAMHSFQLTTLYVWLKDDGIYKTENSGASWKRVPDQGPPDKDVRSLTHSTLPGSMNTGWLYASTPKGIYLSMDCF